MTLSDIEVAVTGEGVMALRTGDRERPSQDEIAVLAYRLYEMRGRWDGYDVDDWLAAERELIHHYQ